ncbi:MAG: universal stress protein [Bacteroidales bacterium]|jgi:nucleotide-binding universal stress UspA family protein|nr:universal stress protein [Bacteroidales bacterium]
MQTQRTSILIPWDFEKPAHTALEQSLNIARLLKLKIFLLYVHEQTGIFSKFFPADQSEDILKHISADLTEIATRFSNESGVKIEALIERGKPHDIILAKAKELNARFIFMGTTNSDENIVGVTTHKVVRSASCPVITAKGTTHYHDGCRNILLPLDLSDETRQKVGWAIEIAKAYHAKIRAISIINSGMDSEARQHLNIQMKQVKNFIDNAKISCQTEFIETENSKDEAIPRMMNYLYQHPEIDLVIIMTQKEIGIVDYFLDSEAQQIIRSAKIPVMSVVPRELGQSSMRAF